MNVGLSASAEATGQKNLHERHVVLISHGDGIAFSGVSAVAAGVHLSASSVPRSAMLTRLLPGQPNTSFVLVLAPGTGEREAPSTALTLL